MRRLIAVLAVVLALTGLGPVVLAQERTQTPPPPEASPQPDLTRAEPLPLTGERRAAFEAYVADALERHGVPGAAIAVVQSGEVVYVQGFGVTQAGGTKPVTPDTLMMIGSITKSMTSAMAATLVDDGLLSWETPVAQMLPTFALGDPVLTERITLADSFCACTGLPRRDTEIVFNVDELGPQELIAQMAQLPLTAPFGEQFQYSNQMYAVGGYAAAVAAGASRDGLYEGYVHAMQDRLLNPTGMTNSTFRLEDVLNSGDYALPHALNIEGQLEQVPLEIDHRFVTAVAPAGALWSNVRDMARYLQMQISNGVAPDGTRVVSEENLARTHQPGVSLPPAPPELPAALGEASTHYGLGWVVGEWRGQPLVHHDGGTFGFASELSFLPESGVGIVLLTNSIQGGSFNVDVEFRLFELLFDEEPQLRAFIDEYLAGQAAQFAQLREQLQPIDRQAIQPYLGRYANEALGEVELSLVDDRLMADTGELRSELRPMVDESGQVAGYLFVDPPLANPVPVTLERDEEGRPQVAATVPTEYSGEPVVYTFTRVAPDS